MCSRVKKKQLGEIVQLRKELEQAKKEISNLSHKVNTLLRERDRFQNPGISYSITDETTVDWRGKLEMEKKVRLAHIQNPADSQSQYQRPKSLNPQSGETINGNKMTTISNHFQMTCVVPDFPWTPPHAVRDVSQMIWPYENRTEVVGALPSQPMPSIRPSPMFYNFQTSAPLTTGFIAQDQTHFENVVPSPPNPYVHPTQAPVILGRSGVPDCSSKLC